MLKQVNISSDEEFGENVFNVQPPSIVLPYSYESLVKDRSCEADNSRSHSDDSNCDPRQPVGDGGCRL
jgi:hypothetical protein